MSEQSSNTADEDARVLARLERERAQLQKVVFTAALIPIVAGGFGVVFGPGLTGERLSISGDSHYRYLAGLMLGIGLMFWGTIPGIESAGTRFRLLTAIVVIGGLSRFLGMMLTGLPSLYMIGALGMELIVTPALCLWQWRISRAYRVDEVARIGAGGLPPGSTGPARGRTPLGPVMPKETRPEDVPEPVPVSGPEGVAMVPPRDFATAEKKSVDDRLQ